MRHEKSGALLELARHLASSAEGLTLDEMAVAAGCGRRTAERMRDALETLFPQMEVSVDGATKRFKIPRGLDGFFQTPTTEELLELAKAAATLKQAGRRNPAKALEALERKVRAAMKSAELRRVSPDIDALIRAEFSAVRAGPRPFEDPETLRIIRHAIMAMQAIRFRYTGGSTPGRWRTICPFGLLFERMNYLVGAEIGSNEPKNFRLDRIKNLELTDLTVSPPESFNLSEYANRSFGIYQDASEAVTLKILPHGAEDARIWRFHPDQVLTESDDGSVLVSFRTSGMLELAWHLFTWGDKVEILEPERLKQTMAEALRESASRLPGDTTESVARPG